MNGPERLPTKTRKPFTGYLWGALAVLTCPCHLPILAVVLGVTSGNGSQRTLSLRGCRNPAVQSWHGHAQVLGHVARRHAAGQQLPG